ncbi:hypothetical protein SAMN05421677_11480 [Halobacillus aidingensis]|uniref:Uncharacterized protein n=1 Tax=Halobacillus aidingensis TaxID=240303 RepID=A0A1H0R5G0_HALAD|nr:hypothetical protein SAMN05421677_11480 [Halobacillus aidingensis]
MKLFEFHTLFLLYKGSLGNEGPFVSFMEKG